MTETRYQTILENAHAAAHYHADTRWSREVKIILITSVAIGAIGALVGTLAYLTALDMMPAAFAPLGTIGATNGFTLMTLGGTLLLSQTLIASILSFSDGVKYLRFRREANAFLESNEKDVNLNADLNNLRKKDTDAGKKYSLKDKKNARWSNGEPISWMVSVDRLGKRAITFFQMASVQDTHEQYLYNQGYRQPNGNEE